MKIPDKLKILGRVYKVLKSKDRPSWVEGLTPQAAFDLVDIFFIL